MKLLIRADGDEKIGTGHVMRCLALAQAWQGAGGTVGYVVSSMTPALQNRLLIENISVYPMTAVPGGPQDAAQFVAVAQETKADWLVVDGYQFSGGYQTAVSQSGIPLLWIDDFGHAAPYTASLILNPNIYGAPKLYPQRLPATGLLMGCDYCLLRKEFWHWQGNLPQRTHREGPGHRVLVTLGGSDPDNVTEFLIEALAQVNLPMEVVVVVGGSNPHMARLETAVSHTPHIQLQRNVTNMPALMAWADIAIAAGGSTSWELCFMGLPTLMVILADNQEEIVQGLEQVGIVINLGWHTLLNAQTVVQRVTDLLQNLSLQTQMSQLGQKLVDGFGGRRAVQQMVARLIQPRPATLDDAALLFEWANDPITRQMSFHPQPISWQNHLQWLNGVLTDSAVFLLILQFQQAPIAQVRFDEDDTISISLSPTYRGKGLALPVLLAAMAYRAEKRPFSTLTAYIKPGNTASQAIFTQAGFACVGETTFSENICLKYIFTPSSTSLNSPVSIHHSSGLL